MALGQNLKKEVRAKEEEMEEQTRQREERL